MTLPGVRVTSVRRTVRVAAVLVTGQALLCAVIGVVTFAGRDEPAPRPPGAEPQLAEPPIVAPATESAPPREPVQSSKPGASPPVRTERQAASAIPITGRTAKSRGARPSSSRSRPARPKLPPVTSPAVSQRPVLPPPDALPGNDVLIPVAGELCDVEGVTGRTTDDKVVRCERGPDGALRWQPV